MQQDAAVTFDQLKTKLRDNSGGLHLDETSPTATQDYTLGRCPASPAALPPSLRGSWDGSKVKSKTLSGAQAGGLGLPGVSD